MEPTGNFKNAFFSHASSYSDNAMEPYDKTENTVVPVVPFLKDNRHAGRICGQGARG
jgi:hypothetical protein